MCIAIVKKAGKVLNKEVLKRCFDANPDGAGFAYINTDFVEVKRLTVYKTLDFEKFWVKYEKAQRLFPESNFLIHFRIKTHGVVDVTNCHPFFINEDECFIHNGIITGLPTSKDESDTMMFNKHILQKLDKGWHKNDGMKKLIEDYIGYSKIAFLNVDNEFEIFNETKGDWIDDIWYSNSSYKERVYVVKNNNKIPYSFVNRPNNTVFRIAGFDVKECDFCRDTLQLREMSFYNNGAETQIICRGCEEFALNNKMISSVNKIKLGDFLTQVNKSEKSFLEYNENLSDYHSDNYM